MIQINNFSKISFHLGTISFLDRPYFNNLVLRKVEKIGFLVESAPQAFYKTFLFCLHHAHECLLIILNFKKKSKDKSLFVRKTKEYNVKDKDNFINMYFDCSSFCYFDMADFML